MKKTAKLLCLVIVTLMTTSLYAKSPLSSFAKDFNKAECVDEAKIFHTEKTPSDFLKETVKNEFLNGDVFTTIISSSSEVLNRFESIVDSHFCEYPLKAKRALSNLIKSFDQIEGIVLVDRYTEDDDSTEDYIFVMKNKSYVKIYFGN